MRFRLLIFLTLSLVTILPVIVLAMWVVSDAQNKENEIIADKHLVIARNLSKALDLYSFDLKNGFELIAKMRHTNEHSYPISTFMKSLNFVHFCIADLKSGVVVNAIAPKNLPCPKKVPPKRFRDFVDLLEEGRVAFSTLMMNPRGIPTLYLLKAYDNKLVIGAVATDYIVQQGNSVSFGQKGHSAIVDQIGQMISHPLPAWRKSKKDIRKIPPVQRMVARKTGTMAFYSPALKADMVTGYSFVPTTGYHSPKA